MRAAAGHLRSMWRSYSAQRVALDVPAARAGVYRAVTLDVDGVGGVERVYTLNNRAVAEMAMRKGWRYSDRLQVPLFKNEWGT